jgi:hypothetical protein
MKRREMKEILFIGKITYNKSHSESLRRCTFEPGNPENIHFNYFNAHIRSISDPHLLDGDRNSPGRKLENTP